MRLGEILGTLVLWPALVFYIGHLVSKRLTKKRSDGVLVRWPMGVAVTIIILGWAGQCTKPVEPAETQKALASGPWPKDPPLKSKSDLVIKSTTLPLNGRIPPQRLDAAGIVEFDNGVRMGAEKTLKGRGVDPKRLTSVSRTVVGGRYPLIVLTRIAAPSQLFGYSYSATSENESLVLVCASQSATPFAIDGTECARQADEMFGTH